MPNTSHRPTERVLDILELLAATPEGLTLTELSTQTGMPKSTITPILHTLADRHYIFLNKSTSIFTIGISTFAVGSTYYSSADALQFIQKEMKYITRKTNEICQLGIRDKNQVLYIAKEDSPEPIRLMSSVGKKLPLYCTAIGKALMMNDNREQLEQLFPNGLQAYTANTITDFDKLEQDIMHARELHYTEEIAEITDLVHCIAIPLYKNQDIIASISVSVPVFRFSDEKKQSIIQVLNHARKNIETFLANENTDISSLSLKS